MKKTGVWAFDNGWALGMWAALLLGTAVYVASAARVSAAEPPRANHEDCPACYFKAAEPIGVQAFYFGHIWLVGVLLHVGKRWATYRAARAVALIATLVVLLGVGHWIQLQSEKKGLFVGSGEELLIPERPKSGSTVRE